MKSILFYAVVAYLIYFYFEGSLDTSNSAPEIVISSPSDDPCNAFKDQRTCNLMSMHDSIKRACLWSHVIYIHNITGAEIETEACISAP